jgi:hypothetical protein
MAEATSCEPISHAVHLSIDMQNIFSSAGIWPTPWMDRVLPGIVRLVAHDPAYCVHPLHHTEIRSQPARPVAALLHALELRDATPLAGGRARHRFVARSLHSARDEHR